MATVQEGVTYKLVVDTASGEVSLKKVEAGFDKTDKAAKRADASIEGVGGASTKTGLSLKDLAGKLGIASSAAVVFQKGMSFVKEAMNYGDALAGLSKRSGVAADTLSALAYEARMAGGEFADNASAAGAIADAMSKLANAQRGALEGSKEVSGAFNDIGISVESLQGMDLEELFNRVTRGIANQATTSEQLAIGHKLLGRGYDQLLPLVKEFGGDMDAAREAAEREGVVIGQDAVDAADRFGDAMTRLKSSLQAFAMDSGWLDALATGVEYIQFLSLGNGPIGDKIDRWMIENIPSWIPDWMGGVSDTERSNYYARMAGRSDEGPGLGGGGFGMSELERLRRTPRPRPGGGRPEEFGYYYPPYQGPGSFPGAAGASIMSQYGMGENYWGAVSQMQGRAQTAAGSGGIPGMTMITEAAEATMEIYNNAVRVQNSLNEWVGPVAKVSDLFRSGLQMSVSTIGDGIAGGIVDGTYDWNSAMKSVLKTMIRMVIEMTIMLAITKALGAAMSGGLGAAGGGGGFFSAVTGFMGKSGQSDQRGRGDNVTYNIYPGSNVDSRRLVDEINADNNRRARRRIR